MYVKTPNDSSCNHSSQHQNFFDNDLSDKVHLKQRGVTVVKGILDDVKKKSSKKVTFDVQSDTSSEEFEHIIRESKRLLDEMR